MPDKAPDKLTVAHVCQTPVAGAAWSWAEAFKEAGYNSFCVAKSEYSDGRAMPSDHPYPPDAAGLVRINNADVILCYQGHPYRQEWYPKHKATVFIYVSQPSHIWRRGEADGWPWAVIGEYQTRLYPGCAMVPNLIPLKHPWFQPAEKPKDRIRIVYSPSNKGATGWDDKGYERTTDILRQVVHRSGNGGISERAGGIRVEAHVITGMPFEQCLRGKATAHIAIDECVTGSYHGNSIQGLALGCVVINNADDAALANLTAFSKVGSPFCRANLAGLPSLLDDLHEDGPQGLEKMGLWSRAWMEDHYQPAKLIKDWFLPLMTDAMSMAR